MSRKNKNALIESFHAFWHPESKYRDVIVLTVLVIVGCLIRFVGLGERSLWVDEIFTIAHAMGNIVNTDLLKTFDPQTPQHVSYYRDLLLESNGLANWGATVDVLRHNNHPPLFFWLMNVVIHLLGDSPEILRLPALLFGVATIPMIYLLGRKIHSGGLGLMAATLIALSGYQILHAQDARPYTMVTLLAITQTWLMLRIFERSDHGIPVKHWLAFALCGTIGLYSHYFYGPLLLFLFGYGCLEKIQNPRFFTALSMAFLLMTLSYLPWVDVLKEQMLWLKASGHFSVGLWEPIHLPEYIWRMVNDFVAPKNDLMKIFPAALFLYSLGIYFYLRRNELGISPLVTMALVWLASIYVFQIFFDTLLETSTINVRRYTLIAAPAYYLLFACAVVNTSTRERLIQPLLIVSLIGLLGLNSWQVVTRNITFAQHFNEATQWINDARGGNDVVLVNPSGPHTAGVAYYLDEHVKIIGLPVRGVKTVEDRQQMDTRIDYAREHFDQLWFVLSQSAPSAKLAIETNLEKAAFYKKKSKTFPKSVEVVLYARSDNH